MSAACAIKVTIVDAPKTKVILQEVPIQAKIIEETTQVVTVFEGARGPTGAAGSSRVTKAGVIAGGAFAGSPKKYAVVFSTPFADATYVLAVTSTDSRSWTYESKTANGFTLNANAAAVLVGEVSWTAMVAGETA